MKKIAFTLLAMIMLFTVAFPSAAFAEALDFSAMADEEIQDIINTARNELTARKAKEDGNAILVDESDVQIYLTGEHSIKSYDSGDVYLFLEAVVINNSDKPIGIRSDDASINGWNIVFWGTSDVSSGKKKKCDFELTISDAEITTFEEVEELEISMIVYDCDSYDTMFTSEPVIVTFN